MKPRKRLLPLLIVCALMTLAVSCSETSKANKFIGEGDAAVKEADKLGQENEAKINQLNSGLANFPENREQLKVPAQEAMGLIDKAIAKLREASSKYDEASKTNIDAQLKEYMSLRSQEWAKHVQHLEIIKEFPSAVLDASVDREALLKKVADVNQRIAKLQGEWTELRARAAAIREKNKDKFENSN
ncbi:MAG TPA: hypothetical protein VF791_00500 [Pyrinomonadaceae bacterium]